MTPPNRMMFSTHYSFIPLYFIVYVIFCFVSVSKENLSVFKERQEAKERGETAKDDGPRLSKKDLEMAEKVSKYNVGVWGFLKYVLHTSTFTSSQIVNCLAIP